MKTAVKAGLTVGDVRRWLAEMDAGGAGESTPVSGRVSWRGRLRELAANAVRSTVGLAGVVAPNEYRAARGLLPDPADPGEPGAPAAVASCFHGCTVVGPHVVCETSAGAVADTLNADGALYDGASALDISYFEGWQDARDHPFFEHDCQPGCVIKGPHATCLKPAEGTVAFPRYAGCFRECNRPGDHVPGLGCRRDGVLLVPVLCRNCGKSIVPATPPKATPTGWTHTDGFDGVQCPFDITAAQPDRPHCVEGCNRLDEHDGTLVGACSRNGVPLGVPGITYEQRDKDGDPQ